MTVGKAMSPGQALKVVAGGDLTYGANPQSGARAGRWQAAQAVYSS